MNIDPNGNFFLSFLIGLGIAALTFGIVNTGTQLVGDLINLAATGIWNSSWEDYLGAFLGGMAGGLAFYLSGGNLGITYGIMGGFESLTTNLLTNSTNKTSYSGLEIVFNASVMFISGFITGNFFGGIKKIGITSGNNSYMSIWKSILTKLKHGSIQNISFKSLLKGLLGVSTIRSLSGLFAGVLSSAWDWLKYLISGDSNEIGYI